MKTYSVSYMTTKNDNGSTASFLSLAEAEACRAALVADGCYHVSRVW